MNYTVPQELFHRALSMGQSASELSVSTQGSDTEKSILRRQSSTRKLSRSHLI